MGTCAPAPSWCRRTRDFGPGNHRHHSLAGDRTEVRAPEHRHLKDSDELAFIRHVAIGGGTNVLSRLQSRGELDVPRLAACSPSAGGRWSAGSSRV